MDKSFPSHACYCDLDIGESPSDCVLNSGHIDDCNLTWMDSGRRRRSPNACKFWLKNTGPAKERFFDKEPYHESK